MEDMILWVAVEWNEIEGDSQLEVARVDFGTVVVGDLDCRREEGQLCVVGWEGVDSTIPGVEGPSWVDMMVVEKMLVAD